MKKVLLLLVSVMLFAFSTGCSNPVYDDFEKFLNTDMEEVNGNYEKIKAEVGTWDNLEDDAALEESLKDGLLPIVDDSLNKLENITPETEEVTDLKIKYVKVMNTYREGFEGMLAGVQEQDEDKMLAGSEKIEEAVKLLEEYNNALEDLAKEVNASIEY